MSKLLTCGLGVFVVFVFGSIQGANATVISEGEANWELSLTNPGLSIFFNLAQGNVVTSDETGTGTFTGTQTISPPAENARAAASAPGGSASGVAFVLIGRTIQNLDETPQTFQFEVEYSLSASVTDDLPGETGESRTSIFIFDITTPGGGFTLFDDELYADQDTGAPLTTNSDFVSSPIVLQPLEEFRVQINIQTDVAAFSPQSEPPSVPEPAAIMLMGLGLAGLGFARRIQSA